MNKIYRVVWNESLSQWVAASELAKGKTKSSSSLAKIAVLAGAVALSFAGSAFAACTGLNSDLVECVGMDSGAFISAANVVTPVTVSAKDWTLDAGRLHVTNTGGSTITFNGTNVTFTNGSSAVPGLIHIASSLAGDAIIASLKGSSITGTVAGTYGLVAHALGTGNASISAANSTFTMLEGQVMHAVGNGNSMVTSTANTITVNGGGAADGITATALNGTATINLAGANTLTMNNGGSALAANGENVSVTVTDSSAVLKTTQASGHGIKATASTGTSTVSAAGTITTLGATADGINSITTIGVNAITNNATIATSGNQSRGIHAIGGAKMTIDNDGGIKTYGEDAAGIFATDGKNMTIINNGAITTQRTNAKAIYAQQSSAGLLSIANDEVLTTYGNNADGIHAMAFDDASAVISIINKGAINSAGHGIFTEATKGATTITNRADIAIANPYPTVMHPRGIYAITAGGDITIESFGGLINVTAAAEESSAITAEDTIGTSNKIMVTNTAELKTQANTAYGIHAIGGAEMTIDNGGGITTVGENAAGIYATGGTVLMTIDNTGGIATEGENAVGIFANGGAEMKITNKGGITTQKDGAKAIYAQQGSAGLLTIGNSAALGTSGEDAQGISALLGDSAIANITNSGAVTTLGKDAQGIFAWLGADASANITNSGAVTTSGVNAQGISAWLGADASAKITNNAVLGTTGEGAYGIYADLDAGAIANITNSGAVTTTGGGAYGIYAFLLSAGASADIGNTEALTTSGLGAHGIFAMLGADASAKITNNAVLGTSGEGAHGIYANGGKETIITNEGGITTQKDGAKAIYAQQGSAGLLTIGNSAALGTSGDNAQGISALLGDSAIANITNSGAVTTLGKDAQGIFAWLGADASANITNSGAVTTSGDNAQGIFATVGADAKAEITNNAVLGTTGDSAHGIYAFMSGANAKAEITNNAALGTTGTEAHGIYAFMSGANTSAEITNNAALDTTGKEAHGIYALLNDNTSAKITNTKALSTDGESAHGIFANLNGVTTSAEIANSGAIAMNGTVANNMGIYVTGTSGDHNSVINNSGDITHATIAGAEMYGINVNLQKDNVHSIVNHSGNITGSQFGIVVFDGSAVGQKSSSSEINILSGATIDAGTGITSDLGGTNTINIEERASVNGTTRALLLRTDDNEAMTNTVTNAGTITSDADMILETEMDVAGHMDLTFANTATGQMTGFMDAVNTNRVGIDNRGEWNVQDRANVTAQVQLSTDVNNSIKNSGKMNFFNQATEFTGVPNFTLEGGTLDLTKHAGAGTTISIGLDNSSSLFTSNGGAVHLDTLLGDASSNNGIGTSDRLLLQNTALGNGATQLMINSIVGSNQGITTNNGIEVVNVAGNSAAGVFGLGHDVISDAYQYQLVQTGNNWYLTNYLKPVDPVIPPIDPVIPPVDPVTPPVDPVTPPVDPWVPGGHGGVIPNPLWPQEPVDPNNPWGPWLPSNPGGGMIGGGGIGTLGQIIYRADAGIELGNRESVIGMMVPGFAGSGSAPNGIAGSGAMRSSTRLGGSGVGTASTDGAYQGQRSNSVWSFATASNTRGKAAGGQIRYSGESYGIQVGGDRIFAVGDGLIQAGVMVNMSQTKTRSRNLITGALARGDSDGYGLGLYGTWFMRADTILSPYIDAYAIFGRYKNTVKTRNNNDYSYRSNAFSFTLQGGYPIALTSDILIEPQAQLTYVKYGSKSHQDHGSTTINMNTKGNMIGRVGAYVYGHGYKFQPYGALNVWYDDTQSEMRYNVNGGKIGADKRGAIVEAKLGFQTQATSNLTLWGEVSGRKGQNSYRDFGGAVGIKYTW